MQQTPVYKSKQELQAKFHPDTEQMMFEGRPYELVQCRKWMTYQLCLFYCAEERHYVKVKAYGRTVSQVDAWYQIGGVAL